ncbi:MAG: carboxypeptidase-like regulatory domain-containing protein [Candidatus Methanomethylicia archaeon]
MVNKEALILPLAILFLLLITPCSICQLYYPLAPPFNEFQYLCHSRGTGYYSYSYDIYRGMLKGYCTSTKNIGSLLDEADLTLFLNGVFSSPFNGFIKSLRIRYTFKGKLYVKSICLPNTFSAMAEVGLYVDFTNLRVTLTSKTLTLYYSGEDEYIFYDVGKRVFKDVNLKVSKGDLVAFSVILSIRSISTGALEDYAYSLADFMSGDYGLLISLSIEYLEDSYIIGSINASKAYVSDNILIDGYLVNSNGNGIAQSTIKLYIDDNYISSTYTDSNGHFTFSYTIPIDIASGERKFKVLFEGNNYYSSSAKEFTVIIPSFSLSASKYSLRIPVGSIRYIDLYINDLYGYDLPVEINVAAPPDWLDYGLLGNNPSDPPFQLYLYFIARDVGEAEIEISANGPDGQAKRIILHIEGFMEPTYTISVTPEINEVFQSSSIQYSVVITPINGYEGNINLYLEHGGLICSSFFSTNPVMISYYEKTVTLTITVNSSSNVGLYDLIVKGVDNNGLTIYSNPFKLNVKRAPYFKVFVQPNFTSIFNDEWALFHVNVTGYNNFNGMVNLEVLSTEKYFKYNFSKNPIFISPSTPTDVVKLNVSLITDVNGLFHLTLHAYSDTYEDFYSFTIEVKCRPLIKLHYINWVYGSWHYENKFLPYEAMGIIVKYDPLKNCSLILPQRVFGEFNSSKIDFTTDNNGSRSFIVFLNGLNCPIGLYEILLLDDSNNIIGKSHFHVDGLKLSYSTYNDYSHNDINFYLHWNVDNTPLRFRNRTLEAVLNSSIGVFRGYFIDDYGVIKVKVPPLKFSEDLNYSIYYANSSFKVKSTNSTFLFTIIPFKNILCDLYSFVSKDFNFNLKMRFYYSSGDPAKVEILTLIYYGNVVNTIRSTSDDYGFSSITFNTSFSRNITIKLMFRDVNTAFVSRIGDSCNLVWNEIIGVLCNVNFYDNYVEFALISSSKFMDLSCILYVTFYDNFDNVYYSYSMPVSLIHGSISYIPFPLSKATSKIYFSIFSHGNKLFEGYWVRGEFSWKML